jgi:hypothetical protein
MAKERERFIQVLFQTLDKGLDQGWEVGEERFFQPGPPPRQLNGTDLYQSRELVRPHSENVSPAARIRKAEKTQFRFWIRSRLDNPVIQRKRIVHVCYSLFRELYLFAMPLLFGLFTTRRLH